MIVGTAGHIDHGKTAVVHALTGVDTDRLPEEKRRGITIELGFAPLELPGLGTVGIVDVPGHEAFVRAMVAGATGIDLGLLIVAADEGVMPQTREHLTILSLLAVRSGIVVLTKCDLAEPDWIELVKDDLRTLVKGTTFESAPIVETSVKDGRGIEDLKAAIAAGLRAIGDRAADDVFRLPVDRAFSVKGTGTVVTGTAWSGRVSIGEEVRLFPGDRLLRVRSIQSHGHQVEASTPGARTAIALAGVDVQDVPRGSVLVGSGAWQASQRLFAEVRLDAGAAPLRPREWLRLHVGTSEVSARVVPVAGAAEGGGPTVARVVPETPLVLRAGDRFILRRSQPLSTIGGGRVVDPAPARRRRPGRAWAEDPNVRLEDVVRDAGPLGLESASIPVRVGTDFTSTRALLKKAKSVVAIEGRLYLAEHVRAAEEAVVRAVVTYADLNPIEEGMPLARLRAEVGAFAPIVDHVVATPGRVEVVSGVVRKKGWRPQVSVDARAEQTWLLDRLLGAKMEPPSVGELKAERGRDVLQLLRMLEKEGKVVAVEPDRFYHAEALAAGLGQLARSMRDGAVHPPAKLREVLGVSRKYLMPLLEYCDRRRITERRGDGRVWLAGGAEGSV